MRVTTFKDHFSPLAGVYARYRPEYPAELFSYLASKTPGSATAWDCATGNGQAARALAPWFERVIATDASDAQLAQAERRSGIEYRVARAESSGLEPGSVDLVTVAQALHWFDLDGFYTEVKRVLKPNGVLAVWSYGLMQVSDSVDAIIMHFHDEVVGPHWPPERRHVGEGHRAFPFPFGEIPSPEFHMELDWTLAELIGYLGTWSAVRAYREAIGDDPIPDTATALERVWGGEDQVRTVRWPLTLRVGTVT